MKIAIIHNQYVKRGGTESYLIDLIKGFSDCKDSVTVFTFITDDNINKNPKLCDVIKYSLPNFPRIIRKYLFINQITTHFDRKDFDISISLTRTSNQDITICCGTHLGYLKHINPKLHNFNIKHYMESYLDMKSFESVNLIITHSQLISDEIHNLYNIDKNKIKLLYPPVDTSIFCYKKDGDKEKYSKKFGIDSKKITLLFPSINHKLKGLNELLLAMKMLNDNNVQLLIAGNPINIKHITNNIHYLGFVNNIQELYKASDFTILPSHYESFGLVVVESIQCGTPVIISNNVGAKDLVTEKEAINIGDVNPKNILYGIKKAISHKFEIEPNFIERNGLTISNHIDKIKILASQIKKI